MFSKLSAIKLLLFLPLFIVFNLNEFCFSTASRSFRKAYYGSPCNSTVKCDIHSLLMCEREESVCQCLYPDAMEYDTDLGTCVSLVNEICGYLETKRVFINCVSNSYCDQQQGVCKCSQGYVESDRHCKKQKGYGESCHSDNECLSELSLTCFKQVCQCDLQHYVPIFENNESVPPGITTAMRASSPKCVALAGSACNSKTGCVAKAICTNEEENQKQATWMHAGVCQCIAGYEMDANGKCRGKFNSTCDVVANVSCVKNLQCLNGICSCMSPDNQVFNPEDGTCVSVVGGKCTMKSDNNIVSPAELDIIKCGKFMKCTNSTCTCRKGFVENKRRECDLSYGQQCTGETLNRCDMAAGLYCVDGFCSCVGDGTEFSEKSGRCVGKIGSSCRIHPPSWSSCGESSSVVEKDTWKQPCSENTKCLVSRAQLEGKTVHGFCVPSKGGTISPSTLNYDDELPSDVGAENLEEEPHY